jgi:hypothetical protein
LIFLPFPWGLFFRIHLDYYLLPWSEEWGGEVAGSRTTQATPKTTESGFELK